MTTSPFESAVTATRFSVTREGWLLLFSLYLFLKPFYLFPSGSPQIADAVLATLAVLVVIRGRIRLDRRATRVLLLGSLFVAYLVIANLVWALLLVDPHLLVVASFYLFNLTVVFVALYLHERLGDRFLRGVAYAVTGAVVLQVALSFFVGDTGHRQTLFFQNPNQLGYWAILSGSLFFACAHRLRMPLLVHLCLSLSVLYLCTLALSKAALFTLPVLFALALFSRPRHVLGFILIVALVAAAIRETPLVDKVVRRLESTGQEPDDDPLRRGYDRFFRFPEYLLLGAGEGDQERFESLGSQTEFHSTIGTIAFGYGLFGAGLFGLFMWQLYRSTDARVFAFLIPPFVFGLVHHGLRFSLLWLLFAVVLAARSSAGVPPDPEPRS